MQYDDVTTNGIACIMQHTKEAISPFQNTFRPSYRVLGICQKDCLPLLCRVCKFQELKVKASQATSVSMSLVQFF